MSLGKGTYPEPAGTESNPVGRSGFRVFGQNASGQKATPAQSLQAWVAARDVSGVCALSVHFITASKIKLGPDGREYGKQGLVVGLTATSTQHS